MNTDVIADHSGEAEKLHTELLRFLRKGKAPRWMQKLWRDGPAGIEPPRMNEFEMNVAARGRPLSSTPQDGNVVSA